MNERIIEIILYLITCLQENEDINESDVIQLTDGGYSDAEIGAAFSWIASKEKVERAKRLAHNGFRVLHHSEKHLFTPEAWGYLMQLMSLSIVSADNIENIIDHASMIVSGRLDAGDIRQLTANVLMDSAEPNLMGAHLALRSVETVH
ncbi:MAG: DUF494 family protein [Chlorobi bacterium]|nr:DUF494 family protein [Chlorobiota bacterium]